MSSFITGLIPKGYLIAGLVLLALSVGGYIKYLQNDNAQKAQTIKEKEKDIENIIEGYEATILLREKLASEKAIATEQKEVVVIKQNKYKEAVIKRGGIKQDEKKCSNCTLVHFD